MSHVAPWFADAKFGVFIHWVLNSVWADPATTPPDLPEERRARAQAAARHFTAAHFDAAAWAALFKAWGARYAVLTTKHHIGFALYDCPAARFTARKSAPAGRDLVAEYVAAMRAAGLKVGLYLSLPDWSHPDYPSLAGGTDPMKYSERDDPPRWQRFLDDFFAEVRHLCTAYGKIDLLWFDGDWERGTEQWHSVELAEMIERLQPGIVMNNRLRHRALGHYGTPESTAPLAPPAGWWEFCTTLGDNWDGPDAHVNLKPVSELVRLFGDMAGMGGNLLLNVAPDRDGRISPPQIERMSALGAWIRAHGEAIYGAEAGLPPGLFNGASTHRQGVLYLIAYDAPRPELVVKGLCSNVARVTHLRTGQALPWRRSGGRAKFGQAGWLYVTVPPELLDEHATVVRVEFEQDTCEFEVPGHKRVTWRGRPALLEQDVADNR